MEKFKLYFKLFLLGLVITAVVLYGCALDSLSTTATLISIPIWIGVALLIRLGWRRGFFKEVEEFCKED